MISSRFKRVVLSCASSFPTLLCNVVDFDKIHRINKFFFVFYLFIKVLIFVLLHARRSTVIPDRITRLINLGAVKGITFTTSTSKSRLDMKEYHVNGSTGG